MKTQCDVIVDQEGELLGYCVLSCLLGRACR